MFVAPVRQSPQSLLQNITFTATPYFLLTQKIYSRIFVSALVREVCVNQTLDRNRQSRVADTRTGLPSVSRNI